MSYLPSYHYHVGTKQQVFEGIKIHLKKCKHVYDIKNKECDNFHIELQLLKHKINETFNEDIDIINDLQKEYDTMHREWLKLFSELQSNETKLLLDLIKIFIN